MKKLFIILTLIALPLATFAAIDSTSSGTSIKSFNLIWSVDTYAPFGYEGRNLAVRGSQITIDAVAEILNGNTNNLKYSWFLEDVFQSSKSGYGRTSFSFHASKPAGLNHIVRLQIFNEDRSIFIEKSIEIPVAESELIAYSSNGNSHFSNQANKISAVISGKEFSLVVKPYFFSIKKMNELTFEWRMAGREPIISSGYGASILKLTVNNNGGQEVEENSLWISASNTKDPRQKATQTVKLNIY